MPSSTPDKLPVPASPVLDQPSKSFSKSAKKKKISKQLIIIIISPIIIIIIIAALFITISNNNSTPPLIIPPTPIPNPSIQNDNSELTPTPDPDLPENINQNTGDENWKRHINTFGGYYHDYPSTFKIKESENFYKQYQPTWFDISHYFDCINRQVGSINPFPCWLLQINIGISDSQGLSDISPESGKITTLPDQKQQYQDGLNRKWTIAGPYQTEFYSIWFAETEIDEVVYTLKTTTVKRSLREYLRNHPDRPFAIDITNTTDTSSLTQAHLNLMHQMLNSFNVFRKPYLKEPDWLRHRFTDNWSIAYPENWKIYTTDEISLQPDQKGLIDGWYGNKETVSFHKYSIILSILDLTQYPPSVTEDIDSFIEFIYNQYNPDIQEQVEIIAPNRRSIRRLGNTIQIWTRTLLNVPNDQNVQINSLDVINPQHEAYIWEFAGAPPRRVIIKQLDNGYEPKKMQELLNTFITKLYE